MPTAPDERKERVIHSRVPESLDDEIKRKARRLGVSVSNLVRNVLEHTVELVEDIVTDGADIARAASERPQREGASTRATREAPSAATVLGWQPAVLELNAVCETCNAILPRGSEASIGVATAGPPRFRCRACTPKPAATAPTQEAPAPMPQESHDDA